MNIIQLLMKDGRYGVDEKKRLCYYESPTDLAIDKLCPLDLPIMRLWWSRDVEDDQRLRKPVIKYFSDEVNREAVNKRVYNVSKTGITSRILSHWSDKDILPESGTPDTAKWKQFSLIETVWLRAVDKMRKYGLSLEKIAHVRTWVLQYDPKTQTYPWFEYYSTLPLRTGKDPYIIVLHNGTSELATSEEIEALKLDWSVVSGIDTRDKHLLLISFRSILTELGFRLTKIEPLKLLSPAERIARRGTQRGEKNPRMVTKHGKEVAVETTETIAHVNNLQQIGKELQEEGIFGELNVKFENGVPQSAQVVRKRRIK